MVKRFVSIFPEKFSQKPVPVGKMCIRDSMKEEKSHIEMLRSIFPELSPSVPNLENAWKLADHFGVTIDYLVGRSDKRG